MKNSLQEWILLVFRLVLGSGGVLIRWTYRNPKEFWAGLFVTVFFGLCAYALVSILWARREARRHAADLSVTLGPRRGPSCFQGAPVGTFPGAPERSQKGLRVLDPKVQGLVGAEFPRLDPRQIVPGEGHRTPVVPDLQPLLLELDVSRAYEPQDQE